MTTPRKPQTYLKSAPREAMADALGLACFCGLVLAGFSLPAFF